MGKNNHIYNSFISGEVSPKFYGRTDTNQYGSSCEEIRNFVVFPQGGAARRQGTRYVRQITKTDGTIPEQVRIFPFVGSDGSRWQIIITDENVNNSAVSGTAVTQMAWQAVRVTDEYVEGIYPVTYEPSTEALSAKDWPPLPGWWDLGEKEVNLNEICFCQAGDVMFFAHGKVRPWRILYNPANLVEGDNVLVNHTFPPSVIPEIAAFTFLGFPDLRNLRNAIVPDFTAVRQMPFQNIKTDAVLTLTHLGTDFWGGSSTGNNTPVLGLMQIDLTTAAFDGSFASFDATWVGRQFKFNKDGSTFGAIVTQYVSSTRLKASVYSSGAFDGLLWLPVVTNFAAPKTYGYGTGAANDSSFELGYWNDTDGWPRTVCFFESRLVFGGTKNFPDTLWFSELNDPFQFDSRGFEQDSNFGDVAATAPFSQNMKESSVTQTRWMVPGKSILAGTDRAEFVVSGPDAARTIALDNTGSSPETHWGGAPVQGIRFDNTTVFLQRDRKTLREVVFNLEENAFKASSISILAEHIVNQFGMERELDDYPGAALPGAIFAVDKQDVPNGIIWCLDNNGCLLGLTRNKDQNIAAWHRHELAGGEGPEMSWTDADGDAHTDETMAAGHGSVEYKPKILAISVIPGAPEDDEETTSEPDDLWMLVRRQVGTQVGSNPENSTWQDIICLEVMTREWERPTINRGWNNDPSIVAPIYMDAAIYWDSQDDGPTGVIDFPHGTPGDEITVLKDGYDLGEFTLDASKQIDISAHLTADEIAGTEETDRWKAICGYNYVARLIPIVSEVPMQTPGSSLGHVRRIDRVTIYFLRSLGVRFGIKESTSEENTPNWAPEVIDFPTDQDDVTAPIPLFTGEKQLDLAHGYETRPQLMIESYRPFPCIIPYVIGRQVVAED